MYYYRGRGRPMAIGSTKILHPTSDNPADVKYCDMRTRNNIDGQRCRLNRKRKLEDEKNKMETELESLTIQNKELVEKIRKQEMMVVKMYQILNHLELTEEEKKDVEERRKNVHHLLASDFEIS